MIPKGLSIIEPIQKWNEFFILIMIIAVVSSCLPTSINSKFTAVVYDSPSIYWKSNDNIPVCWENKNLENTDAANRIFNIVKSTYSPVDFHFTGWQLCQENSDGIRIVLREMNRNTRAMTADFGARVSGIKNGMILYSSCETPDLPPGAQGTYCIEDYAVHEFGHALGLLHEHSRPESPCGTYETTSISLVFGVVIGQFDDNSIMRYPCSIEEQKMKNNSLPILSPSDKRALKLIHSRALLFDSPKDFDKKCTQAGGTFEVQASGDLLCCPYNVYGYERNCLLFRP